MPLYLVSYDLNKAKNYQKLWDEMDRLGGHKPLESVYFLDVTSTTATVLRDHLKPFIDEDDQLIVVPFDQRPSTFRAKQGTQEWLDRKFG
ncbi:CRISPR-associated endonuclease Cas2 [Roseovarius sp. M141]|uniref:CRISPR-associated endonuclease Cas2 n=1 Tax=Roseovarius sp. M141 TaxID=2583806 RepID=UPI0020CCACB8|nr:CRISPR-associated endonuclease Cas2 [Roseovarius sp. M141]MCQ0093543.1 CRISPR-associated endonuclease Cas2 [Roseovarius sp. M141]